MYNASGGKSRPHLRAFLLTAVLTLAAAVILIWRLGMYPFGEHHLCYSDADQYYGFYGYLLSTFLTKNNLFYSWSMALGNGMMSTYAYYASSPLNLLLVFFRNDLMLGTQVIAFVRFFIISLNFCALLNHSSRGHEVEKGIISVSYALIGYTAFYAWNASWLDGVAFLPLLILGLEKLVEDGDKGMYVVVLALAVFSNFYIGYMLCGASLLFYLTYCLNVGSAKIFDLGRLKRTFLLYAGSSVLGAGLSMVLLLPAYLGIPKERKEQMGAVRNLFSPQINPVKFLSMFFTGSVRMEDVAANRPVVYIGILPFVLVLAYYVNKKIKTSEKIKVSVPLLLLFISFEMPLLNMAWHGFAPNHWFNYRYSFIFSFVLLLIAYRSMTARGRSFRTLFRSTGAFLLIALLVFFTGRMGRVRFSPALLAGDVLCGLAGVILVGLLRSRAKYKAVFQTAMCLLVVVNISCNAVVVMRDGTQKQNVSEYFAEKEKIERVMQYCSSDKVTRIGRCSADGRCEAAMYGYASVSSYASTENTRIQALLRKLGYAHNLCWSDYSRHAPQSTDDLLGIRYILYDYHLMGKPFKLLETFKGTKIYANRDALPLIYETRELYRGSEGEDDFAFQNGLFKTFDTSGQIDGDVFEKAAYKIETDTSGENCVAKITIKDSRPEVFYMQLPEMTHMEEIKYRSPIYNSAGRSEIEYTSSKEIYTLGRPDEKGRITAEIGLDSIQNKDEIVIYKQKEDVLSDYVSRIRAEQSVDVRMISSSHLEFTSAKDRDVLYTSSIPYDEAWYVTVDGEKTELCENAGGLLAFPVKAGRHTVTMLYRPKGAAAGLAVSILSLLIFVVSEFAGRTESGEKDGKRSGKKKSIGSDESAGSDKSAGSKKRSRAEDKSQKSRTEDDGKKDDSQEIPADESP